MIYKSSNDSFEGVVGKNLKLTPPLSLEHHFYGIRRFIPKNV